MKKHTAQVWMFVAAACVTLACLGSSAPAGQKVGQVVSLTGKAAVKKSASAKPEPLALQAPVYERDVILTEQASKVKIRFDDGTQVTVAELSSLEVREFVLVPKKEMPSVFLVLASGAFRAVVNNVPLRDAFVVQTPTAVAAVRGTDWMGEIKADSTGVVALRGMVAVSSADPNVLGEVTLTDRMGTDVKAGQPPTPPKEWSEKRRNALLEATDLP